MELYLSADGTIAFVMPFAAMSRGQFEGFRSGRFGTKQQRFASVEFAEAWGFSSDLQPLFPVPSCVLFAKNEPYRIASESSRFPDQITYGSGELPRRDATNEEAERALTWHTGPRPAAVDDAPAGFVVPRTLSPRRDLSTPDALCRYSGSLRATRREPGGSPHRESSNKPREGTLEGSTSIPRKLGEGFSPSSLPQ